MNRTIIMAAGVFSASSLLLVDSAVKGTALLVLAAIAAMILRRDSAATRHLVWLLAIVAMLVVPVLSAMLPQWRVLPEWAEVLPEPAVVVISPPANPRPAGGRAQLPRNAEPEEVERPKATAYPPAAELPDSRPAFVAPEAIPASAVWSWNWINSLPLVWAIGFSVLILRLILARWSLWNSERQATVIWSSRQPAKVTLDPIVADLEAVCLQLGICRPITLLVHPNKTIPVVWGIFRSRLLLPAAARHWGGDQMRSVLLHELAHVKRRDTMAQLLAQFACALYWFNPLVWLAAWQLRVERERACDDLVLASGVRPSAYAGHLLEVVTELSTARWTQSCGLAMARKSSLEGRLAAILGENLNRRGVSVALAGVGSAIAVGIAVPIAMLRAADLKTAEKPNSVATDMKPRHEDAQALFGKWRDSARTDGKIPGGALGSLARTVANFLKLNPKDERAPKLAELLKRIDTSRDWTQTDAIALLDDLTAIYPGLMDWEETARRFSTSSPIQTGNPLPAELTGAAWGQPAANGVRAAWRLDPAAGQHPLGSALKARILIHNTGKEAVVFRTPSWHQYPNHTARDAKGSDLSVTATEWTTEIPLTTIRLAPGEYAGVEAHGIAIGARNDDEEEGNRTGLRVGAWIEAKAGDEVTFLPATVVASEDRWTSPKDRRTPLEMWKAIVRERIEREGPMPAAVADRDLLIRRVMLDLIGVQPTPEEIATFATDNTPRALTALVERLVPRIVPFAGDLPVGEIKFRVTAVDADAATEPSTATGPGRDALKVVPGAPVQVQEPQKPKDGAKLNPGMEENLQWGEPVNGLRAALAIRPAPGGPKADEMPELYLAVQNVSNTPIRLCETIKAPRLRYLRLIRDGEILFGIVVNDPSLADVMLQPREVAFLLMFASDSRDKDGRTEGSAFAEGALRDTHETLVAELKIELAPAGAWTGKIKTGETSGRLAAGRPQPKDKNAQALFNVWQHHFRGNGNIPGGLMGRLRDKVNQFIRLNNTGDGSRILHAKKMELLVPRLSAARDWPPAEVVALMDDIAAITPIPLITTMDEATERTFKNGEPLPPELANAPWGGAQPNGLRVAWLMEPQTAEYRLGTSLKSRILFHNSGKDTVVFRTRTWHQGGHTARDAKGADIKVDSVFWTTIGQLAAFRLEPGEFIEVRAAGIGVGANENAEDWQNARVGSWVDAKAGDDVTVTTGPVALSDRNEGLPKNSEPHWWLDFINAHLAQDLPLPTDTDERTRLVYRAGLELFGTPLAEEEIAAFVSDREPTALAALANRLAHRPGLTPSAGGLTSGPTKFRVLPADPDGAKKPRTASNPGRYTLGENIWLVVSRRFDGFRRVNEASIQFFSPDPTKPAPGQPHKVKLPDGYNTWAAAWERGSTVLWVLQKGNVRVYDFTNPAAVKEATLDLPANLERVPRTILDAVRAAVDLLDEPKQAPAAPATEAQR